MFLLSSAVPLKSKLTPTKEKPSVRIVSSPENMEEEVVYLKKQEETISKINQLTSSLPVLSNLFESNPTNPKLEEEYPVNNTRAASCPNDNDISQYGSQAENEELELYHYFLQVLNQQVLSGTESMDGDTSMIEMQMQKLLNLLSNKKQYFLKRKNKKHSLIRSSSSPNVSKRRAHSFSRHENNRNVAAEEEYQNLVFNTIQSTFHQIYDLYSPVLFAKFPAASQLLVQAAIEHYIVEDYIFEYIFIESAQDAQYDDNLTEKLNIFTGVIQPKHLDIAQLDVSDKAWLKSVKLFRSMNKQKTVYGKMSCLQQAFKNLFEIETFKTMGGDSLLSLVIYLILYSNIRYLHSTMKFLLRYGELLYEQEMVGQWGYFLTNLSIAVSWWKSVDLEAQPITAFFHSESLTLNEVEEIITKWNKTYSTRLKLPPDSEFVFVDVETQTKSDSSAEEEDSQSTLTDASSYSDSVLINRSSNLDVSDAAINEPGDFCSWNQELNTIWTSRPVSIRKKGFVDKNLVSWDYVTHVDEKTSRSPRKKRPTSRIPSLVQPLDPSSSKSTTLLDDIKRIYNSNGRKIAPINQMLNWLM
jgi:hypothetical protein